MNRHPKQENLKPFKKGQSGNPKGAPHKLPNLEALLAKVLGEETNGRTALEKILAALRIRAMKGGSEGNRAAELLMNRGYGMPKQSHELTGKDGNPIENKYEITLKI